MTASLFEVQVMINNGISYAEISRQCGLQLQTVQKIAYGCDYKSAVEAELSREVEEQEQMYRRIIQANTEEDTLLEEEEEEEEEEDQKEEDHESDRPYRIV